MDQIIYIWEPSQFVDNSDCQPQYTDKEMADLLIEILTDNNLL